MERTKLEKDYNSCPKCKVSWEEDMFTAIRKGEYFKEWTDEEIREYMEKHWKPPYISRREIGIEIEGAYDGVSYWMCPDCKTHFSRWTGIEVDMEEERLSRYPTARPGSKWPY